MIRLYYYWWKPEKNKKYVISNNIISPWGICRIPVTCKWCIQILFWNIVKWEKRFAEENEIL
jgi:hypothetical protein